MKVIVDNTPMKAWRPESKVPRALLEAAFMVLLPRLRKDGVFRRPKDDRFRINQLQQISTYPRPIHISAESLGTEPVAMLAGRVAEAVESLVPVLNELAQEGMEVVTVDLEKPGNVDCTDVMECGGISLRVVRAYNLDSDAMEIRFDILCAVVPVTASLPPAA